MIGDLNGNKDFTVIKPFAFWTQHVLPLVYGDEISYMETLDKVVKYLNELIKNNNELPTYIQEVIKEYITSGDLEVVIRDVLANFMLNVKYPPTGLKPAVGDGTSDDTKAIQGCIDYAAAKGYGAVYFPSGQYLTDSLVMKNNVSLFAFDRYSTELVLKGGATAPLLSGNVANNSISNFTIKGNAGIQVNDITLIELTGNNTLLNNLIITDGYKLLDYTGNGGHLQMYDIVFGSCVTNAATLKGNCIAQVEDLIFNNLSAVGGVDVFNVCMNDGFYKFTSNATCSVCLTLTGNNNVVDCRIVNAKNNVADSGTGNNVNVRGVSDVEFMSKDKNVSVGGNLVEMISGMVVETISGDKKITAANITETVSGDKTVVAGDISETANNKTVVAGDISETANNKTVDISEDLLEDIKGNKTVTVVGSDVVNAQDIILNPTNPLTYKKPTEFDDNFKYINFKDSDGAVYKVLVAAKDKFDFGSNIVSPYNFGAVGDGITDDYQAFADMINESTTNGKFIYIPKDSFMLSKAVIADGEMIKGNFGTYPSKTMIVFEKVKNHTFKHDLVVAHSGLETYNIANGYALQSAIYIPSIKNYVCGFNGTETVLVQLENDFKTIVKVVKADLDHVNDLHYDDVTNSIFAVTGDNKSNKYFGRIVIINANTLTVTGTAPYYNDTGLWDVSYSEKYKCWFVVDNAANIITLDDNFNVVNKAKMVYGDWTVNCSFVLQGSCIFEDQLFISGSLTTNGLYNACCLNQYNLLTGDMINSYQIKTNSVVQEVETFINMGNYLQMVYGQQVVGLTNFVPDYSDARGENTNFSYGEYITENGDLNDYIKPGRYTSPYEEFTLGLKNRPGSIKGGFTMDVFYCGADHIWQLIRENNLRIAYRDFNTGNGYWNTWVGLSSYHAYLVPHACQGVTAATIPANGNVNVTIKFAAGFYDRLPVVFASFQNDGGIPVRYAIVSITAENCVIKCYNDTTNQISTNVLYFAINGNLR